MTFEQNVDRDARLVKAGMSGGFEAVCAVAMFDPEFAGGPDTVIAHGEWLKAQPKTYIDRVIDKIMEEEKSDG